jgi:hypothetical protein
MARFPLVIGVTSDCFFINPATFIIPALKPQDYVGDGFGLCRESCNLFDCQVNI